MSFTLLAQPASPRALKSRAAVCSILSAGITVLSEPLPTTGQVIYRLWGLTRLCGNSGLILPEERAYIFRMALPRMIQKQFATGLFRRRSPLASLRLPWRGG